MKDYIRKYILLQFALLCLGITHAQQYWGIDNDKKSITWHIKKEKYITTISKWPASKLQ